MFQIIPICLFVEGGEKKSADESICLNRMFADSLEKSSCDTILKDISSLSYCLLATSKNFEKCFIFQMFVIVQGKKLIDRIFEGLKLALLRICMIGMMGEGELCISKDWGGVWCSYTRKNEGGGRVLVQYVFFVEKKTRSGFYLYVK